MPWRWIKSPLIQGGEFSRRPKVHDLLRASGRFASYDVPRLPNADDAVRRSRVTVDAQGRISFDGALVMCHTLAFAPDFAAVDADPDCTTIAEFADPTNWRAIRLRGLSLGEIIDRDTTDEKTRVVWRRRSEY